MNKQLQQEHEALEHSVEGQESPKTVAILKAMAAEMAKPAKVAAKPAKK